jgi:hypothetical protein
LRECDDEVLVHLLTGTGATDHQVDDNDRENVTCAYIETTTAYFLDKAYVMCFKSKNKATAEKRIISLILIVSTI